MASATLVIGGCSHGTVSALPTAPTTVVPVVGVRNLTITPTGGGTIIAGGSAPITSSGPLPSSGAALGAYAQYTDGTGKYVEAIWTTSDANVLVVLNGTLRALSRGVVTLTAAAEGLTATETFIVEPGIPGTWVGTLVIDQCAAGSASMQELICSTTPGRPPGAMPVGASVPVSFSITQSGTDLTAIAALGQTRGTLSGIARGENFLALTGALTVDRTTINVIFWDSRVKIDVMEGVVGFEVRIAGTPSHANVAGRFAGVTRR